MTGRVLAGVVLVLGLAACGSGGADAGDDSAVATDTVDMPASYRFEPAAISVASGTTVTWTNSDNFTHTVRIDGEIVGEAAPGGTITSTFDDPGTYRYDCSLHPQDMTGVVTVT